jgi:hypothetical protein
MILREREPSHSATSELAVQISANSNDFDRSENFATLTSSLYFVPCERSYMNQWKYAVSNYIGESNLTIYSPQQANKFYSFFG